MILLYLFVFAGYALAAWTEWRGLSDVAFEEGRTARVARIALPLVLIVHGFLVVRAVWAPDGLDLSLGNALSAVACVAALIAWLGSFARGMPGVPAVMLPVAAIAAVLPLALPNPHRFSFSLEPWAALHIGVALVAYGFLIVAALQALLLMGLERRLRQGVPEARSSRHPPLLVLETFTFRLLAAGYLLLTLTLGSGILFSEDVFGKPLTFTHKIVFSILSWVVYGGLLFGRLRYGWRGRAALKGLLAGTLLLILAYIGSKFVLEVVLKR